MQRIGLLSDTHSHLNPSISKFFANVDEIWHAGDIGDAGILVELKKIAKLRAVYGNIDNAVLRNELNEYESFTCEDVRVLMIHIGGYPGRYEKGVRNLIDNLKPDLFISGHSHILKVINDPAKNLLHMNPGAAGNYGFHQVITALKFEIEGSNIKNLEVYELERK